MRILFIGAANSNHTLRWTNELSERGHDVYLLTRKDQRANPYYSKKTKIIYLKHSGGIGYFLNARQTRKVFKKIKPDIVNVHYLTGYGFMSRLARIHPVVLSAWGSDVFDFPYLKSSNKKILKKNVFYADSIASTSQSMKNELLKLYPDYKKNITVTPFGVDVKRFNPNSNKNDSKDIVIGIVKYLKPIYNVDLLIKAFAIASKKVDYKILLHIYGDGELREELQQQCKELGIEKLVTFFGVIPNEKVPDALSKMDIFVNCSLTESFGVAVLEAMAMEKPVIVTQTPGYLEIVSDSIDGMILKDRNPDTMADAIIKLANDKELRCFLGKNGRKKVESLYDWGKNVSIMERLYLDTANDYCNNK